MITYRKIDEQQFKRVWKEMAGVDNNGQMELKIPMTTLEQKRSWIESELPWLPSNFWSDIDLDDNGDVHAYEACLKTTKAHYFCANSYGRFFYVDDIKPIPHDMRASLSDIQLLEPYFDNDIKDGYMDRAELYRVTQTLKRIGLADEKTAEAMYNRGSINEAFDDLVQPGLPTDSVLEWMSRRLTLANAQDYMVNAPLVEQDYISKPLFDVSDPTNVDKIG